jgi:hypothetical protein
MPLSIEAKNSLFHTARCLRDQDERTALDHFSRLEPSCQNAVYHRLWEVMGRPQTHPDFGRAAFWGQDGQTAPLLRKVYAVEHVLSVRADTPIPVSRDIQQIPSGAIPIIKDNNACGSWGLGCDHGLDPRCSFDGTYINPPQQLSLWETLLSYIAYLEFVLSSYLSFDPEERSFRQMILTCAKAELGWAKVTELGLEFMGTREHDFLESASDLYKHLHPQTSQRLYPNELLIAIHLIDNLAIPNWERADDWGLWRLQQKMYLPLIDRRTNTSRGAPLDPIENRHVPPYLFFHAIRAPSQALKTALREYRAELASITTDAKCARSFQACKERLLPKLEAFHAAWNNYINSHELLQEVRAFFEKEDHYRSFYDNMREQIPDSWFSLFLSELKYKILETCDDVLNMVGIDDVLDMVGMLSDQCSRRFEDGQYTVRQRSAGYNSLKTSVQRDFPHSHSARLLAYFDETRGEWI